MYVYTHVYRVDVFYVRVVPFVHVTCVFAVSLMYSKLCS